MLRFAHATAPSGRNGRDGPRVVDDVMHKLGEALLISVGMGWQVAWSLILGFLLSGIIQTFVSQGRMQRLLGRNGVREIALATAYGAASSSCSYASAAVGKTLFKKGAAFIPSLAFLFSSTNLVVELGIVLYLLMGWQFTVAEWLGGIVLVVIMSVLVKVTYPKKLVEEARRHVEESTAAHDHGATADDSRTLRERILDPQTRISIAQTFAMDWSMLWKDLVLGFLIAGALAALVPDGVWKAVFLANASPAVRTIGDALIGPLIAIVTFVCSIGNVPMAAILWSSGIGFGGVLSFLYADLIVLPLLDVYRKYYGTKMAAYIGVVFFVTMAVSGLFMDLVFQALHRIPRPDPHIIARVTYFSFDYTFYLNVLFGAIALYIVYLNKRHPSDHEM